ncbi:SH3 domain-containing protein [Streptomyces shaanxiensis]|uniref:SH3 domain-containing protein n=1 Tax=Streptomyces shaanxiensis TaxID=653357 RepID=A0ABP7VPS0_9ACTN
MALRSRLAISIAAGALAAAAFTTPAVASDEWESDDPGQSQGDGGGDQGGGDGGGDWGGDQGGGDGGGDQGGGDWGNDDGGNDRGFTRGRVTANRLLLRSAPHRGSRVIRVVHRGDVVRIFCKTSGQRVDGNPLWYLLADGTWTWGSGRFIDTIGAAPRWC